MHNVTSRARKISFKFVEKMSIFNRIYRANIVTNGPRSTSKVSFVEKLLITFLAQTSWLAALAPHAQSQRIACFNRISRTNIVTSLLAIACKARLSLHCDFTQAIVNIMWLSHGDPAADQIVRGPSGGCRGDLISTPDSGYYRVFYKSFLLGNVF